MISKWLIFWTIQNLDYEIDINLCTHFLTFTGEIILIYENLYNQTIYI